MGKVGYWSGRGYAGRFGARILERQNVLQISQVLFRRICVSLATVLPFKDSHAISPGKLYESFYPPTLRRCLLRYVVVFLILGCAEVPQSGSMKMPGAVFAGRSTFRFLPDKSQSAVTTPDWRGIIGQDILYELNVKRYRFFPMKRTDLLVGYHIVLSDNENVLTLTSYLGYPIASDPSAQAVLARFQNPKRPGVAKQGLLVIDFIDPKKNVLLWRGWTTTGFRPGMSQQKFQVLAKEAVNRVLASFPARY
jgi:Domain of unknown function (DUF4136)